MSAVPAVVLVGPPGAGRSTVGALCAAVAGHPGVLVLGGGAVLDPGTRAPQAESPVVHLAPGRRRGTTAV
ncbi:hypothetical protein [Streptomyces sp. NPDC012510]|uniref:hypothetical protein n=1 Tax=Streptomyces sp. NPDC012510 TaxID=3364838 RepID=UPI0036E07CEE